MKATRIVFLSLVMVSSCSEQSETTAQLQSGIPQKKRQTFQLPPLPEANTRNIFSDNSDDQSQSQWHQGWKVIGTFSVGSTSSSNLSGEHNWQAIVQTPEGEYITVNSASRLPQSNIYVTKINKDGITVSDNHNEPFVVRLER